MTVDVSVGESEAVEVNVGVTVDDNVTLSDVDAVNVGVTVRLNSAEAVTLRVTDALGDLDLLTDK